MGNIFLRTPPIHLRNSTFSGAFRLIVQVGLTVVAGILAGLWVGMKADALLGMRGPATAAGVLSGIVAGMIGAGWLLYRNLPWNP